MSNCHVVAGRSLIDLVASRLALRAPALRAATALTQPNQSAISLRQHDSCSLNNLVSSGQQRFRDGEAERLGGLEVHDHLEFCRKLHRQVGRLFAA